jgi:uncharacterized DUF497 family protein
MRLALFEWDSDKERTNFKKHKIHFADTFPVFEDERAVTIPDERAKDEERMITLGMDTQGRVSVVVYTWRGDRIRLISARKATPRTATVRKAR